MVNHWTKILLIVFLITSSFAMAAVAPDHFENEKQGLTLLPGKTGWIFLNQNDFASHGNEFVARPVGNKNHGALTLHSDKSTVDSLKKYSDKWLKDYPKFGYELVLAQDANYGDLKGYEIELVTKEKNQKKIHQFITKGDGEFLIFTCSSDIFAFEQTWKNCQEILKTAKLKLSPQLILPK